MTDYLKPEINAINAPYWQALEDGYLQYQVCDHGHAWLPPRNACPVCLNRNPTWKRARGTGRIYSFVIYRVAYHESFKERLPYNVTIVELDEGPRLVTNILAAPEELTVGAAVKLQIDRSTGTALACFALA